MYKKVLDMDGNTSNKILFKKSENVYFPVDISNRYYQEYLEWLAEGNTPEEAE